MDANEKPIVRLMLGGDVMLGRQVKESMLRHGADYPLGPVAGTMRAADLTLVNLECAITSSQQRWPGAPKAFYFGAPPEAALSLVHAGIDMVSLANNHVLDFGVDGLRETLHHLERAGIRHAGAGKNSHEATAHALADCKGMRFGMAAFCDHQADFAAGRDQPGIAYIDLDDEAATLQRFRQALQRLHDAGVNWPILSLHWGPNMVLRPSQAFRRLAHAAIGMGWRILYGHSAHVFHGIEIHHGCPILYAAGDLVDDYHVDPQFRNDRQLLFELALSPDGLRRIRLHPVRIAQCQVRPAAGAELDEIAHAMTARCTELGTQVRRDGKELWIDGPIV